MRSLLVRVTLPSLAVALAAACGDVNADLSAPLGATRRVDAGSASESALGELAPLLCPLAPPIPPAAGGGDAGADAGLESEPEGGAPPIADVCSLPGVCEYGASADRECNQVLACDGSRWSTVAARGCHEEVCPPARQAMSELDGTPCALDGDDAAEAVCAVSDGTCTCTTGPGGAELHPRRWVCSAPLLRDCPLARPRIGASCEGALYCDYNACRSKRGFALECHRGVWRAAAARCGL